jgi:hypothetical protein
LNAGVWFRRDRLLMVSPVRGNYRRCQAETPLIVLCRFPGPALFTLVLLANLYLLSFCKTPTIEIVSSFMARASFR